jgi:AraC-like DNA-binding protein
VLAKLAEVLFTVLRLCINAQSAGRAGWLVGLPASATYLTQWRMLLAANLLLRSSAPLARIAEDVGYKTDTACIRAFRRECGVPPAAWHRQQSTRVQAP